MNIDEIKDDHVQYESDQIAKLNMQDEKLKDFSYALEKYLEENNIKVEVFTVNDITNLAEDIFYE